MVATVPPNIHHDDALGPFNGAPPRLYANGGHDPREDSGRLDHGATNIGGGACMGSEIDHAAAISGLTPVSPMVPTSVEVPLPDRLDVPVEVAALKDSESRPSRSMSELSSALANLPECLDAIECLAFYGLRVCGPPVDPDTGAIVGPYHPTVFDSSIVPPMHFRQYVVRMAIQSGYGDLGLAYGLVLFARHAKLTERLPTLLSIHRLFLASMVVGVKANSDIFLKNSMTAQFGGVSLAELNDLEVALLLETQFSAVVRREALYGLLHNLPRVLELDWRRCPSHKLAHFFTQACCILTGDGFPDVAPAFALLG